jgi:hypothetical protein
MIENEITRQNRKNKFLEKFEKNNINKNNFIPNNNNLPNNNNNNYNNYSYNNDNNNNNNNNKINYLEKYENIENLKSFKLKITFFKQLILILLTFLQCYLKIIVLYNFIIYFIFIEISSFFLNLFLNRKIRNVHQINNLIKNEENNNTSFIMSNEFLFKFKFLDNFFEVINYFISVFSDISIIILLNLIYLIYNSYYI